MLQVNRLPLPSVKSKEIQAWLALDGARAFIRHLEYLDAELTAEAGNALCQMEENTANIDDAKLLASKAIAVRALIDLFNGMRNPDYEFATNKIEPSTTTTK